MSTTDPMSTGDGKRSNLARYALVNDVGQEVLRSSLTQAVAESQQRRAPADQWISWLSSKAGVKPEEIEWSGVVPWLQAAEGLVTRHELLSYLQEAEVDLVAIQIRGNAAREAYIEACKALLTHLCENEHFFRNGAEDYVRWVVNDELTPTQIRLASPQTRALSEALRAAHAAAKHEGWSGARYQAQTLPGGTGYTELLITLADGQAAQGGSFSSKHYPEHPNILGHVRFNERAGPEGERVLFIEELQSDWHQAGRRQGYRRSQRSLAEIDADISHATRERTQLIDQAAALDDDEMPAFRALMDRVKELADKLAGLSREWDAAAASHSLVPDAPFKKTWPMLLMKQMVRYAADHGYDRIAWTTGEQQAQRYDLRRKLSRIQVGHADSVSPAVDYLWVKGWDATTGAQSVDMIVRPSHLHSVVGVAIAQRILEDVGAPDFSSRLYYGDDIQIGGEGMIAFYDQRLVTTVNRYITRWGARVGDTSIEIEGKGPATVHSFVVTDAMRNAALAGQPLFRLGGVLQRHQHTLVSALHERHWRLGISNKVTLRLVEQLHAHRRDGSLASASGRYLNGLLDVSMEAPDGIAALNHEAVHAMRDLGLFSPAEWAILEEAALANDILMADIRQRYRHQGLTHSDLVEEAIAEMYADWASTRSEYPSAISRLFERMRDFVIGIGRAIRGAGFHTKESLFRAIERGDVGRRGPRTTMAGRPKYATPSDQTLTQAFKRWFGDSKVVDSDGRPSVVYHGTMSNITAFNRGDGGTLGSGIYFAKDPDTAGFWAGNREAGGFDPELGGSVIPAYVRIIRPADGDTASDFEARFGDRAWIEMEKAGFDGVIADNEVVAFRPDQIKSAIGNNGTFDPSNPDIRYSLPRGNIGRSMSSRERTDVLTTLTDVYKLKGAPRESKGVDANGNDRIGFAYSPDLFEKSDITGAMVRYYVTLPDGRKAHPTELFPNYTQSDIDVEMARRQRRAADLQSAVSRYTQPSETFTDKAAASIHWDRLSEASLVRNGGRHATIYGSLDRDFLTDGLRFIMVPSDTLKDAGLLEAFGEAGWRRPLAPSVASSSSVAPNRPARRSETLARISAELHKPMATQLRQGAPTPETSEVSKMRNMTTEELNTVRAALRYWQREGLFSGGAEHDIATDHGGPALTAEEIDDLCEAINLREFAGAPKEVLRDAAGSINALLHEVRQMRGMFKDEDGTIAEAVTSGEETLSRLMAIITDQDSSMDQDGTNDEEPGLAMG